MATRMPRLHTLTPQIRHLLLRQNTSAYCRLQHSSLSSSSSFSSTASRPSFASSTASSSVDQAELSHFSRLASTWWDAHGSSQLLHLMNPVRHDFITRCLTAQPDASPMLTSPSSPSLHYLDVGCGGGIFAESAARLQHTASVTALDPTPEVLAVARAHMRQDPMLVQSGKLEYKCLAIEELPPHTYDVVTLFEVLEHVSSPSNFLRHLTKYVKPGGWLFMSTIARTWTSWATTKLVAEDILRIVPQGTHDWDKYINEPELRDWFKKELGSEWDVTGARSMGVVYIPGFGWREVTGSEKLGNYFFGIRKV